MTKSKIFLYLCLSFISGIFLDSLIKIPQLFWLGILISGLILISVWWPRTLYEQKTFARENDPQKVRGKKRNKKAVILGFCLIVLVGGVFRHNYSNIMARPAENNKEIIFKGIVIKEPEIRSDKINLTIKNKEIGKILIAAELYPQYEYGDELEIKGELKIPIIFEDFNYQEYLAKDGIYRVTYYPEIKLTSKNQGNIVYQSILRFKNKLRENIYQTLPSPQNAILSAIFLGDQQKVSGELKEKFNITGTQHIMAISGMNMVIIAEILLFLGLGFGLWRGQAFYFVLIFLFLYIIIVGAPASAIRAGIMSGLLLLAQKIGRLNSAHRAVIFAGVIMLAINPLLLKFDAGFQLSFMAVLGIIFLKPILDKRTETWPNPLGLKDVLTMTFAAQLGVLPLLIFNFGQLSLISPLANLLIVPFLPIIMLSGLVLSLVGLVWLSLAKIIAWPIWLLLTYIIKITDWLSLVPLAAYKFNKVSWLILVGYYLVLAIIVRRITSRGPTPIGGRTS